jgi:hypothetical protein
MESNIEKQNTLQQKDKSNKEKIYTMDIGNGLFMGICAALFIIAMYIIIGWIVKWTWNMSISEIFGVKEITLYQAIALFVLSSILFGSKV